MWIKPITCDTGRNITSICTMYLLSMNKNKYFLPLPSFFGNNAICRIQHNNFCNVTINLHIYSFLNFSLKSACSFAVKHFSRWLANMQTLNKLWSSTCCKNCTLKTNKIEKFFHELWRLQQHRTKYCNGAPQSISVVYTTITFFFSQGLLIWIVQITIIFK